MRVYATGMFYFGKNCFLDNVTKHRGIGFAIFQAPVRRTSPARSARVAFRMWIRSVATRRTEPRDQFDQSLSTVHIPREILSLAADRRKIIARPPAAVATLNRNTAF